MKTSIRPLAFLVLLVFSTLPCSAAPPSLSEVCVTWTGLEKSSRPKFLSRVTLKLNAGSRVSSKNEPDRPTSRAAQQASSESDLPRLDPYEGQPVRGVIESTVLSGNGTSRGPSVSPVQGVYFEEYGLLRFKRIGGGAYALGDIYGLLSEDGKSMGVLFSGSLADHPPFVLFAGTTVPEKIRLIAGLGSTEEDPGVDSSGMKSGQPRTRGPGETGSESSGSRRRNNNTRNTSVEQRTQRQALRAQYQADVKAVQEKIAEATRARDRDTVARLRQELKRLRADYNESVRSIAPSPPNAATPAPADRSGSGSRRAGRSAPVDTGCPEHVTAWVSEMLNNGATMNYRNWVEMANLFRPSVFTPHFGKPFIELNQQESGDLVHAFQRSCTQDRGAVAKSGIRIPLRDLLGGRGKFGVMEAKLAGEALDIAGNWLERSLSDIRGAESMAVIESFQSETEYPLRALWPRERESAKEKSAIALSNRAVEAIEQYLDTCDRRLKNGNPRALVDMHSMQTSSLFGKVAADRRSEIRDVYWQRVDGSMESYFQKFRTELTAVPDHYGKLEFGRKWYSDNSRGIVLFEKRPPVGRFLGWFGNSREESFASVKETYLREIAAIGDLKGVFHFYETKSLPLDSKYSPTWLEIDAKLNERKAQIERELFIARVGEGPFGPDYPGAIYLNAIYRMDHDQIREESQILHYSISHAASKIGFLQSSSDVRAQFLGAKRGSSLVDPLLAYFAGAFQRHYPRCMEPGTRIFRKTTYFRTITTSAFGGSYVSSETSQTSEYRINNRHAKAFEYLEDDPASAGSQDMYMSIFGGFFPDYVKSNLNRLTDALRGLQMAMEQRPCSDPVIQQLDRNMIELFNRQHGLK